MNERPKRTDTEEDVLKMQEKFLAEKRKNASVRPSAQVVRIVKEEKKSLFAQSRLNSEVKSTSTQKLKTEDVLLGEIVEKDFIPPIAFSCETERMETDILEPPTDFPKPQKVDFKGLKAGKKSLFAMSMERKRVLNPEATSTIEEPSVKSLKENYGERSLLVEEDQIAKTIHEENLRLIAQMKQEEILAEREKLLKSLDPNLLQFIQAKRNKKLENDGSTSRQSKATQPAKETSQPARAEHAKFEMMESGENVRANPTYETAESTNIKQVNVVPPTPDEASFVPSTCTSDEYMVDRVEVNTVAKILKESEAEKWLHFDVIEKDKFEWMKDVPDQIAKLKRGEVFEARFDWKGVLLPYTEPQGDRDDRDLYLHGEDPHRPGYTLQELFRLCRSNIIQQRLSGFGAIVGILNIYNQGFYDSVLDLPITKIFFLLRFGFDENSPSVLEVVSRALAMLFYNETDELLLDIITETSEGYLQPILSVADKPSGDIENVFSKLKLTSAPLSTKIEENEEESKTSMNDFELAENDLIECLLRTNIVQRIYYILNVIRRKTSTIHSCLKILIRIARSGKEACMRIATDTDLIKLLFECFLPRFESIDPGEDEGFYNFPQYLVLKLFRIMISQHNSFYINLKSYGLQERIRNYLHDRQDIRNNLIKVQIESFRILRSMVLMNMDGSIYRDLIPAFRYMLQWHYQNVVFGDGGNFLIRQHAAALLSAIHSGPTADAAPILSEMLSMCSSKWYYEATKFGISEFSQSMILTSCLNCVARFMTVDRSRYIDFINKYFRQFVQSKSCVDFVSNLRYISLTRQKSIDRRNIHPPLLNVGSILQTDGSPQLIVSQKYPVYLLNSILNITENLHKMGDNEAIVDIIKNIELVEYFTQFLEKTSRNINKSLSKSFLLKPEIRLAFKLLCFKPLHEVMAREVILQAAYNLVCCMSAEHIVEIEKLFDDILFNENNLNFDERILRTWKNIFLGTFVYPHRIVIPATEMSLSMPCFQTPLLPFDWPYLLLKSLLHKYLQQISDTLDSNELALPEQEIITVTLQFAELLESNELIVTSPTEKLMYLMISFMGPDSVFLEPDMKQLLRENVQRFFVRSKNLKFDFDAIYEGKSKFENLYVLFLDHFQAASYGDPTFSALLFVPLAQKYDNKWRKMVWSEHASVLRFLDCDESELLGGLDDYINPIETDDSLVKSYAQALHSTLLRANTIPYKIAEHHVKHFVKEKSSK